jgi:transcriptional regulator with XRE-family HTH domain
MDISKAIRTIREEKRLTQLDVADKLQMERSNYARLEARGSKLSVEQLEQIAQALGVSVMELMIGEPQKAEDTGKVKELEKRIVELEEMLQIHREDKRRLKSYFLKNVRDAVENIVKSELVWTHWRIELESSQILAEKIVENVILTRKSTGELIAQVSPLIANLYYFLLRFTTDDKKIADSSEKMVYTGDMQKTSEAIWEYIRLGRLEEEANAKKLGEKYLEVYEEWEGFVKRLTPEQENLLKSKRELFKAVIQDRQYYDINVEIDIRSNAWSEALNYALKMHTIDTWSEILVIRNIIDSGIISIDELAVHF